jgi:hypothetical protein
VYANRQRARAADPIVVPAPNRPIPPRHQRVTDAELAERAGTLRQAVEDGSIPLEDAVASLVRTCGVEPDVARDLLGG